ncbi:hypothetical protein PSP6_440171 [Paraburkholderia tropica]|nr:hypothetical protein PSP6_440171 [Paraburkholderia tropica]
MPVGHRYTLNLAVTEIPITAQLPRLDGRIACVDSTHNGPPHMLVGCRMRTAGRSLPTTERLSD